MRARFTVSTFLTPGGCLGISGHLLEDLAADALLPMPTDQTNPHRPVPSCVPVRITVEQLTG